MKNSNLLYFAWRYNISILYEVQGKRYSEDYVIITHKNYSEIHEQFPKFIMRKLHYFFHDFRVIFISAEIVELECLNW